MTFCVQSERGACILETVAPLIVVSSTVSALIIVDQGKILNPPEAALEHRYGRQVLLSPRLGSAAAS